MLHKKPALLLSSYTSLPAIHSPSTSCTSCRKPARTRTPSQSASSTRNYAQHASEPISENDKASELHWPEPVHPYKTPSPYQILSHRKGEPYTKARFYDLAKIYHPDQCSHPSSPAFHLPHATRLERYRLLVAAHTILSDPQKRSAYDSTGYGWAGHATAFPYASPYQRSWERSKQWSAGHDPMHNATWEDWERWYEREERQESTMPVLSNFGFISIVITFAIIGGFANATRANNFGSSIVEQRDKIHHQASQELVKARGDSRMADGRNERIQSFLRHRESTHADDETIQRLLAEREKELDAASRN